MGKSAADALFKEGGLAAAASAGGKSFARSAKLGGMANSSTMRKRGLGPVHKTTLQHGTDWADLDVQVWRGCGVARRRCAFLAGPQLSLNCHARC